MARAVPNLETISTRKAQMLAQNSTESRLIQNLLALQVQKEKKIKLKILEVLGVDFFLGYMPQQRGFARAPRADG